MVALAVVLARPLGALSSPSVSVAPAAPGALTEAPPTEAEAEPPAEPEPSRNEPVTAEVAPPPEPTPEPAPVASAAAPAPAASAAQGTPSPSASQARPTEAAFASAVRATPIVMFSTSWCTVCQTAREFLGANGLSYSERDIDRDDNAREELKRRTGKTSIPTLEVDGQLLTPGFSEQKVIAAVAASAKRRSGVDKVEIRRTQ